MNILRAVQVSTPNLPTGSLKTREIFSRTEVTNVLSEKQIMILETAENLLPEELREAFIRKMLECSRDNKFLDCTRDIAFPSIAQYYPNLPNFPNFRNQVDVLSGKLQDLGTQPSMHLLRDGIYKPEIEANTEYLQQIENQLQN